MKHHSTTMALCLSISVIFARATQENFYVQSNVNSVPTFQCSPMVYYYPIYYYGPPSNLYPYNYSFNQSMYSLNHSVIQKDESSYAVHEKKYREANLGVLNVEKPEEMLDNGKLRPKEEVLFDQQTVRTKLLQEHERLNQLFEKKKRKQERAAQRQMRELLAEGILIVDRISESNVQNESAKIPVAVQPSMNANSIYKPQIAKKNKLKNEEKKRAVQKAVFAAQQKAAKRKEEIIGEWNALLQEPNNEKQLSLYDLFCKKYKDDKFESIIPEYDLLTSEKVNIENELLEKNHLAVLWLRCHRKKDYGLLTPYCQHLVGQRKKIVQKAFQAYNGALKALWQKENNKDRDIDIFRKKYHFFLAADSDNQQALLIKNYNKNYGTRETIEKLFMQGLTGDEKQWRECIELLQNMSCIGSSLETHRHLSIAKLYPLEKEYGTEIMSHLDKAAASLKDAFLARDINWLRGNVLLMEGKNLEALSLMRKAVKGRPYSTTIFVSKNSCLEAIFKEINDRDSLYWSEDDKAWLSLVIHSMLMHPKPMLTAEGKNVLRTLIRKEHYPSLLLGLMTHEKYAHLIGEDIPSAWEILDRLNSFSYTGRDDIEKEQYLVDSLCEHFGKNAMGWSLFFYVLPFISGDKLEKLIKSFNKNMQILEYDVIALNKIDSSYAQKIESSLKEKKDGYDVVRSLLLFLFKLLRLHVVCRDEQIKKDYEKELNSLMNTAEDDSSDNDPFIDALTRYIDIYNERIKPFKEKYGLKIKGEAQNLYTILNAFIGNSSYLFSLSKYIVPKYKHLLVEIAADSGSLNGLATHASISMSQLDGLIETYQLSKFPSRVIIPKEQESAVRSTLDRCEFVIKKCKKGLMDIHSCRATLLLYALKGRCESRNDPHSKRIKRVASFIFEPLSNSLSHCMRKSLYASPVMVDFSSIVDKNLKNNRTDFNQIYTAWEQHTQEYDTSAAEKNLGNQNESTSQSNQYMVCNALAHLYSLIIVPIKEHTCASEIYNKQYQEDVTRYIKDLWDSISESTMYVLYEEPLERLYGAILYRACRDESSFFKDIEMIMKEKMAALFFDAEKGVTGQFVIDYLIKTPTDLKEFCEAIDTNLAKTRKK